MSPLTAKRPGRCADCGGRIEQGDPIRYYPAAAGIDAETTHEECPEPRPVAPPAAGEPVYDEDGCSSCGAFWASPDAAGGLPDLSPCCGAPWLLRPGRSTVELRSRAA